jgi:NADH:ubiquinone oxidoreductase subunit 2 (subunit N)
MDFSTYINSNVVTAIGLFSILIGALGVYKTLNLRIILVYSSLFNMGFALVLLSFGFVPLAFSYFLVYCIFSFLLVFFLIDLDCDTSIV